MITSPSPVARKMTMRKPNTPDSNFDSVLGIRYHLQFSKIDVFISSYGSQFTSKYPDAAKWLKDGDRFYHFTAHVDGTHGSSANNPVVLASTKKGKKEIGVYGELIQAGGTGMESGDDLSDCKTNVEKVSKSY